MVLVFFFISGTALAALTEFSGIDAGVSSGPNSLAARNSFISASGSLLPVIDFETLAVGTLRTDPFKPVAVSPGVSVNYFGDIDSSISLQGVSNNFSLALGFNTTSGGSNYLGFIPTFNPQNTPGMTWTFTNPIYGWGVYISGLEPGVDGVLHVLFNDGASHDLIIPDGSDDGGIQFYGFLSDQPFSLFNFEELGVSDVRDIFGVDDVLVAVPEPATMFLLGSGLIGLAGYGRKKFFKK